jgi:hypothetical protein
MLPPKARMRKVAEALMNPGPLKKRNLAGELARGPPEVGTL